MEKCDKKNCQEYTARYANNCLLVSDIKKCPLPGSLTGKSEPVSEVPCSDRVIKPCPFCGSIPVFPEAKDVYGTCYDAGCEDCGVATISLQIIDCFDRPRDHVHDSWDEKEMKYADEYIEVAKHQAETLWNGRAL